MPKKRTLFLFFIFLIISVVTLSLVFSFNKSKQVEEDISPDTPKVVEEETKVVSDDGLVPELVDEVEPIATANWWEYPDDIKTTTKSGNDLLVLVNKEYRLPSSYVPGDLVNVGNSGIRTTKSNLLVRSIIISDLNALNNQAKVDGVDLAILSAYRSYSTQASTYQYWVNYNGSQSAADQISARAGHSQHQLGTTVDFTTSEIGDRLGGEFDGTKASQWLLNNAYKYGFVLSYPEGKEGVTGYAHESWHWRYIGRENAKEMVGSGQILEVFLRSKN